MRVLLQRVSRAQVQVDSEVKGTIGPGLVLLVGIGPQDDDKSLRFCAEKCANLRVFADETGKMNRSVRDVNGSILAISQFTLYGDCRKGRRPSFVQAAPPEQAGLLYQRFITILEDLGMEVAQGVFGAHMSVEIHNDGPVTLLLESP